MPGDRQRRARSGPPGREAAAERLGHGFDRDDLCVAFTGGVLTAGPLAATVGGVVIRVHARGHGYPVHIIGIATGEPYALPVPLPALRRNVDTDFEHSPATSPLRSLVGSRSRTASNLADSRSAPDQH